VTRILPVDLLSSKSTDAAFCALSPLCRPLERSSEDVDIIFTRLKEVKAFEKFHPNLLQQICLCGYYENLEKGITCKKSNSSGFVFSCVAMLICGYPTAVDSIQSIYA
jgi:hypothetical protein